MLYIVLPVHNRSAITSRFLTDLTKQTYSDYVLVLVDDGCTDDTVRVAQQLLPPSRLKVLQGNGQLWWAGALHLAHHHLVRAGLSSDDAVLVINDDVRIPQQFLTAGLALLAAHPDACIQAVGKDAATGHADHGAIFERHRLSFRAAEPGETPNCLSTRGLLMCGITFAASGGFRPRWLPHYLSDYEFTIRVSRRGARLMTDPVFSLVTDSTTSGEQSFGGLGVRKYFSHSFSNRAMYNPLQWSALAALVCPPWIAPVVIAKIWASFVARGLRIALQRRPVH
jgi:GT2 family glycosyltransferase